ncbi:hypothetical protein EMCRGX_G010269 [Ephydatia muelleri]
MLKIQVRELELELTILKSTSQSAQNTAHSRGLRCWLGNPNGPNIWIPGGDSNKVLAAELVSGNQPSKLAVQLMSIFFSAKELQAGNCTPTPSGRPLLDANILNGIRLDETVWKKIVQVNLNAKCRTARLTYMKLKGKQSLRTLRDEDILGSDSVDPASTDASET